jgi:hypothetical protein
MSRILFFILSELIGPSASTECHSFCKRKTSNSSSFCDAEKRLCQPFAFQFGSTEIIDQGKSISCGDSVCEYDQRCDDFCQSSTGKTNAVCFYGSKFAVKYNYKTKENSLSSLNFSECVVGDTRTRVPCSTKKFTCSPTKDALNMKKVEPKSEPKPVPKVSSPKVVDNDENPVQKIISDALKFINFDKMFNTVEAPQNVKSRGCGSRRLGEENKEPTKEIIE